MNIYDLLRRLLPGPAWQEWELAEAREVIAELEQLNVFGTAARSVSEQHEHQPEQLRLPGGYNWATGESVQARLITRCKICGKDL